MKTEPTFLRLARTASIDEETAYTILRLIDVVGWEIKEDWDWNWLDKMTGDFRPQIDGFDLDAVWELLRKKEWLSLQRIRDDAKPITSLTPLADLANLRSLVLQGNVVDDLRPISTLLNLTYLNCVSSRIVDLQPLSALRKLRNLECCSNRITGIFPLEALTCLEELNLADNPITSMAVLDGLPRLNSLEISNDQVNAFSKCRCLPSLRRLDFRGLDAIKSLTAFPDMPSLKVLSLFSLDDLSGIERMQSLTTVRVYSGTFMRLDPLSSLKHITHISLKSSNPLSLKPLQSLYSLRSITVTAPKVTDISGLSRLPALREIEIDNKSWRTKWAVRSIRADLAGWAKEFAAESKRGEPSLDTETVDQETFDRYDGHEAYGILPDESEDGMFVSEADWVCSEICDALKALGFKEEDDFCLPQQGGFHRSQTLVVSSLAAYESFHQVVTQVQKILCTTKNDWIIYFQSLLKEGPDSDDLPDDAQDFILWIYPNKIVATAHNTAIIGKLLAWNK